MSETGSQIMLKCAKCKHFMICHVNGKCGVKMDDGKTKLGELPTCSCTDGYAVIEEDFLS